MISASSECFVSMQNTYQKQKPAGTKKSKFVVVTVSPPSIILCTEHPTMCSPSREDSRQADQIAALTSL